MIIILETVRTPDPSTEVPKSLHRPSRVRKKKKTFDEVWNIQTHTVKHFFVWLGLWREMQYLTQICWLYSNIPLSVLKMKCCNFVADLLIIYLSIYTLGIHIIYIYPFLTFVFTFRNMVLQTRRYGYMSQAGRRTDSKVDIQTNAYIQMTRCALNLGRQDVTLTPIVKWGIINWTQFIWTNGYLDLRLTGLHKKGRLGMQCKVEKIGVDPMSIIFR